MIQVIDGEVFYQKLGKYPERSINVAELVSAANYRVKNVAKELGISARQLERQFKESIGISPKIWLLRERMKDARRLIVEGYDLPTVARKTGYQRRSYFTREFHRQYGMLPETFIKRERELRYERNGPKA